MPPTESACCAAALSRLDSFLRCRALSPARGGGACPPRKWGVGPGSWPARGLTHLIRPLPPYFATNVPCPQCSKSRSPTRASLASSSTPWAAPEAAYWRWRHPLWPRASPCGKWPSALLRSMIYSGACRGHRCVTIPDHFYASPPVTPSMGTVGPSERCRAWYSATRRAWPLRSSSRRTRDRRNRARSESSRAGRTAPKVA